jgi:hypothetical protein
MTAASAANAPSATVLDLLDALVRIDSVTPDSTRPVPGKPRLPPSSLNGDETLDCASR